MMRKLSEKDKGISKYIKKDVWSFTGSNYRNMMLLIGKFSGEGGKKVDVDNIDYFPLDENET